MNTHNIYIYTHMHVHVHTHAPTHTHIHVHTHTPTHRVHTAILSGSWIYGHVSCLEHLPNETPLIVKLQHINIFNLPNLLKNIQYCSDLGTFFFFLAACHTNVLLRRTAWLHHSILCRWQMSCITGKAYFANWWVGVLLGTEPMIFLLLSLPINTSDVTTSVETLDNLMKFLKVFAMFSCWDPL